MIPIGLYVCKTFIERGNEPIDIEIISKTGLASSLLKLSQEEALEIATNLLVEISRRNQVRK